MLIYQSILRPYPGLSVLEMSEYKYDRNCYNRYGLYPNFSHSFCFSGSFTWFLIDLPMPASLCNWRFRINLLHEYKRGARGTGCHSTNIVVKSINSSDRNLSWRITDRKRWKFWLTYSASLPNEESKTAALIATSFLYFSIDNQYRTWWEAAGKLA